MNKKTLSTILNSIMGLLAVGIVILVILIAKRGPKPTVTEENITDVVVSNNEINTEEEDEEDIKSMVPDLICVPDKSSTSVNVRSGAGKDYERIGSAYPDCEYVVLSVTSSGWTEIEYDDVHGYISSEFLSYTYRYELGDGTYSYEAVSDDISNYKAPEKN